MSKQALRTITTWTWWTGLTFAAISFGFAFGPAVGLGIFWTGFAIYGLAALMIS